MVNEWVHLADVDVGSTKDNTTQQNREVGEPVSGV